MKNNYKICLICAHFAKISISIKPVSFLFTTCRQLSSVTKQENMVITNKLYTQFPRIVCKIILIVEMRIPFFEIIILLFLRYPCIFHDLIDLCIFPANPESAFITLRAESRPTPVRSQKIKKWVFPYLNQPWSIPHSNTKRIYLDI